MKELETIAARSGLRINIAKTKAMRINTTNTTALATSFCFCYLGNMMATTGCTTEDVQSLIAKAGAAYGGLINISKRSGNISRQTKLQIFKTVVW